jgi:hypothetical protein
LSTSTLQTIATAVEEVSLHMDTALFRAGARADALFIIRLAHNPLNSHSQAGFYYSREEMEHFGAQTGWQATYIGDWQHPRHLMMMQYAAV